MSWYYQPYVGASTQVPGLFEMSPFGDLFPLRGITFPAWTLAAFAIGAMAGMLIRRVVPAIVATLAVYVGLAFAAGGFLRQHYLTPLVTTNLNTPGAAVGPGQWFTKDGKFAFAGRPAAQPLRAVLPSRPVANRPPVALFRSALPRTATPSGPATSRPAGSGPSSGSRAAGCSRCQCCSSP